MASLSQRDVSDQGSSENVDQLISPTLNSKISGEELDCFRLRMGDKVKICRRRPTSMNELLAMFLLGFPDVDPPLDFYVDQQLINNISELPENSIVDCYPATAHPVKRDRDDDTHENAIWPKEKRIKAASSTASGGDEGCIVHLRGLPFDVNERDIRHFLFDAKVSDQPSSIVIQLNGRDLPTGDAHVRLASLVDVGLALARHKQHMGARYIEVFRASNHSMIKCINDNANRVNNRDVRRKGTDSSLTGRALSFSRDAPFLGTDDFPRHYRVFPPQRFPSCGYIRVRGLPYHTSESDIYSFFQTVGVMPTRIVFTSSTNQDAVLEFSSVSDSEVAMAKDKDYIGSRFIDLHRISPEEFNDKYMFANRTGLRTLSTDGDVFGSPRSIRSNLATIPSQCSPRSSHYSYHPCRLKLRGLPFSASARDVENFFTGFRIIPGSVHLPREQSGRSSGLGFIDFESSRDAELAMRERNMQFINHRYIELSIDSKYSSQGSPSSVPSFRAAPDLVNSRRVRLRGLPFSATKTDIINFFPGFSLDMSSAETYIDPVSGRPNGVGCVSFLSCSEAMRAIKERNHAFMNSRYIELSLE
uniref:RRM domain-containing protein n=1 Tax=Spongospora subterranea TaxID=70186 RepID=A0A0H5R7D4_9EUKA|eukprot:CRZ09726.1 hypothetical protein [Spongospora subterranea]